MSISLRFTPNAYYCWRALCLQASTEIGAFGWCSHEDDPLLVTSLWVPKQVCTPASVEREPDQTARCIAEGAAAGLHPGLCTRVWLHTHPGDSPEPSGTDEKYWDEFSKQHGHVMGIMARGGRTFARLALRDVYCTDIEIPVSVVPPADVTEWAKAQVAEKVGKPAPVAHEYVWERNSKGVYTQRSKVQHPFCSAAEWERRQANGVARTAENLRSLEATTGGALWPQGEPAVKPLTRKERKRMLRLQAQSDDPNGRELTMQEFTDLCDYWERDRRITS